MKNRGFTIAETLITIAIMGVIAGILFPVVYKNNPNEAMIMYKKTFSVAERAAQELLIDDALYPDQEPDFDANASDEEIRQAKIAAQRLSGFSNTDAVSFMGRVHVGNTKFCTLMAAKLGAEQIPGEAICPSFKTTDGVFWTIDPTNFNRGGADGSLDISVDVLGEKCQLNRGVCRNTHAFGINIDRWGRTTVADPNSELAQGYLDETDYTRREEDF